MCARRHHQQQPWAVCSALLKITHRPEHTLYEWVVSIRLFSCSGSLFSWESTRICLLFKNRECQAMCCSFCSSQNRPKACHNRWIYELRLCHFLRSCSTYSKRDELVGISWLSVPRSSASLIPAQKCYHYLAMVESLQLPEHHHMRGCALSSLLKYEMI